MLREIDFTGKDASDRIELCALGVGAELVVGRPVPVQRLAVVVVGEFVARHVAEVADVVDVLEVLEHGLAVEERLVVAEVAGGVAGEGLRVLLGARAVHVVAHLLRRVDVQLGEERDALARTGVAELAAVMVLAEVALEEVEIREGDLGLGAGLLVDVPAFVEGAEVVDEALQLDGALGARDVAVERQEFLGVDVVELGENFHFGFFVDVRFGIFRGHFGDGESGDLFSADETVGWVFCWESVDGCW